MKTIYAAAMAAGMLAVAAFTGCVGGGHDEATSGGGKSGPRVGDTKTITLPGGAKMEMVWCPPGSFTMGGPEGETGRDYDEVQHCVTLTKGFWLGKYEVTQAQWMTVMGGNPSWFKGADNPVEKVSWNDCQEFIRKLNAMPEVVKSGLVFRLPTEKEWEYACRAGAVGDFCKLSDGREITSDTLGEVAWYDDNSGMETHPVGRKKPNAFGLYDMHGNVLEWTQTSDGDYRVFRGGSCYYSAGNCESSYRDWSHPSFRNNYLGFRLCASGRAD